MIVSVPAWPALGPKALPKICQMRETRSLVNQALSPFIRALSWQRNSHAGIFGQTNEFLYKNVLLGNYFLVEIAVRFWRFELAFGHGYNPPRCQIISGQTSPP